jgi:hypothetical protein
MLKLKYHKLNHLGMWIYFDLIFSITFDCHLFLIRCSLAYGIVASSSINKCCNYAITNSSTHATSRRYELYVKLMCSWPG